MGKAFATLSCVCEDIGGAAYEVHIHMPPPSHKLESTPPNISPRPWREALESAVCTTAW
jgi:hypothetical protein